MRYKTKESRTEKTRRYMRLSKKDIVAMLVDTEYCLTEITKKLTEKPKP